MDELVEYLALLEEMKKRKEHVSQSYVPDTHPKRNQKAFHESDAWCRLVFGGNRSGKSRSNAQEIYWWTTTSHPFISTPTPCRVWVLSAEYRTLFEGIWYHLKDVLPYWDIQKIGAKVPNNDIPSYVELKNGSRIDFISAQGGEDTRRKIQAAEINLLSVDEEISGELWDELQMRLLTRGGRVIISATLVESQDWLLDLEDRGQAGDKDINITRLDTRYNKYNDEIALKRVLSKLSPEEQQVRILGHRRKTSGLMYTNWRIENTEEIASNVIEPFKIPEDWTRIMAIDPGYRVFAGLWIAVNPLGLAIGYREMYFHYAELAEVVKFIKISEIDEKIHLRLIDPNSFKHYEDGSLGVGYQLAEDYNLDFNPAINEKRQNVEDVRRWLMPTSHLSDKGKKIPGFRVFNTLENFLMERRKYKVKPEKPGRDRDAQADRPLKKFDHLMNCWEYLATSRVDYIIKPTEEEELITEAKMNPDEVLYSSNTHRIRVMKKRRELERMRDYD